MFKINKKNATTTPTVSLFLALPLTLGILVSLLFALNIFDTLHDIKNAEIRASLLPLPPQPAHKHLPNIGPSNFLLFKYTLRRINSILRCVTMTNRYFHT